MTKILAVTTNKGGALKTSITTNLAGVLSSNGNKVLIIDLDNQGNAAVTFGVNPDNVENTVYDVLMGTESIFDSIINVNPNLDMLVSNDDMAFIEMDVLTNRDEYPNPLNLLSGPLDSVKDKYDYILIDTPPAMGMIAANVFNCAEDILIPYQPEVYAFRSMVKSITAINNFKKTNTELNIKAVIPVKVRNVLTHDAFLQSAKALCDQNGVNFSETIIPESIRYAESVGRYKLPITLTDDNLKTIAQYKQIYFDLAKELGYIG